MTGLRVVREKLSGLDPAPLGAAGEQLRQQIRDAINDAKSAQKIDAAAALENLSRSCDSWLARMQQLVSILRSNLDFTVSELGLQIEEHQSFLRTAHERESSIRQKLAKCGTHSDFLNVDAALLELRQDLDLFREVGTGSDPNPARLAKDAQSARILAALADGSKRFATSA